MTVFGISDVTESSINSLNDEGNFPNGVEMGHDTFEAVTMEGNGEAEFIGVSV